jgi:predicted nucleic acid-binding protein
VDLVVDASIAIKWLIREPDSEVALGLRAEHNILAPAFLLIECRNALLTGVRRGKLTPEQARSAEAEINAIGIHIVSSESLLARAFEIALELGEPIYDCIYLAAAIATDRRLITADQRFIAAAGRSAYSNGRIYLLGAAMP